tara:strand:- start:553 stop:768 length:216 start_codon:yes stop_codon:yes gene_type:complete
MTAKILNYPHDPNEIKWLMSQEKILKEDLRIHETYDERVETRKKLRKVQEKLSKVIRDITLQSISWEALRK